jgi:hypothetical protein
LIHRFQLLRDVCDAGPEVVRTGTNAFQDESEDEQEVHGEGS